MDMLGITVYLDGENVEITGTIDTSIVLTPSSKTLPLSLDGRGRQGEGEIHGEGDKGGEVKMRQNPLSFLPSLL
jgi:hypothetical protein